MNTLLSKRLQTIEKQCWANAQYSKRDYLEISGIPSSVSGNDLEDVVCKTITKAGVEVSDKDIEDCHQVGKSLFLVLSSLSCHFKCQERLDKTVDEGLATDWSRQAVYQTEPIPLLQSIVVKK